MGDMSDNSDYEPIDMEEAMRIASEANKTVATELAGMGEDDLRALAHSLESMLASRFSAVDLEPTDEGLEVTSMYLPQIMMDAVQPYITGILLTEDSIDVVPNSDLPLMCRVDGYMSID